MPTSRYFFSFAEDRTIEEQQPNVVARLSLAVPTKRRL
jgi:hypothetical protein